MEKSCFVIMPFSKTVGKHDEEYWTDFFETIKRIMEEIGYVCTRSEVGPYKLFTNIAKNIESSDLVIAVLTDFNANVWYELGIRHTLKTGTIMLLQEGQKAPFDISDFGIIFYKDSIGLEQRLKKSLKVYIDKFDERNFDSPVISALNNKVYNNDEKKLEEMLRLIWHLIDEVPRDKKIVIKGKTRRNRILWVDDYPSNTEFIRCLFEDRNVQFDIALTTKEALSYIKDNYYDMIITDMGRGNERDAGLTLLKELKLIHCQIPVVICASRRAIERYGEESLRLGAYTVTYTIGGIISIISDVLEL